MLVRVYHRLSRASDDSTSIARQRDACRALAASRWPGAPVEVYEDVDISGWRDVSRPAYDRMVADIREHRGPQALIVYRIDRLTRRGARQLLELVEDVLRPADCALVSATEPVDTAGPFGELLITLLAVFAKMESDRISERGTATKAFLRTAGRWSGGPVPYGYRAVQNPSGSGKILEVDPEAAEVIRSVARQVIAGTPLSKAIPPGRTYHGWKRLLTNPVLAGYQTLNKKIVFDKDGEPLQPWPPILEPSEWRQLQPLLARPRSRAAARRSLLGGYAVCGNCGHRLSGARHGRRQSYQCTHKEGCQALSINMPKTDEFVLGACDAVLPKLLAQAEQLPDTRHDDELARLETVRAWLDEEMDRLLFEQRKSPDDPAVQRLQDRIDRAMREADALRTGPGDTPPAALASVVSSGSILDLPLAQQRRVVEILYEVEIKAATTRNRWDPDRIRLSPKGLSQSS